VTTRAEQEPFGGAKVEFPATYAPSFESPEQTREWEIAAKWRNSALDVHKPAPYLPYDCGTGV
jgi:hypothetical protein